MKNQAVRLPPLRDMTWSGGGSILSRNLAELIDDPESIIGNNAAGPVLWPRNHAPLSMLRDRKFIYMPQNAWPWHGPYVGPKEASRFFALKGSSILAMRRCLGALRISESIPGSGPIVHNVLDRDFEKLPRGAEPKHPYILSVGTLAGYRNHETVIDAFERYRSLSSRRIRLVVLGRIDTATYSRYLGRRVAASPFRNDILLESTKVERSKVVTAMAGAQLVVFPSLVEASPLSVLESLAVGATVIASDITGHQGILRSSDAATLTFPPRGSAVLSQHMSLIDDGCTAASVPPSHPLRTPEGRLGLRKRWRSNITAALNEICAFR